ncbi:hypothetical protein [Halpernia frigidisoli]|nr:hypothetical protein [Halpernia frigidisoli]
MNLVGKVKNIEERVFEVNNKKLTFDNGILMPASFNYNFDENGYVNYKEDIKKIDGKEKISTKQYFTFEKNKPLTELYLITEFADSDSIIYKYKYLNDSLITKTNFSKSYKGLTERITISGNKEFSELSYPSEKVLESKTLEYNRNNKFVFKETIGFDDKEIIERKYKQNSNCTDFEKENITENKFNINSTQLREYDQLCNLVKITFINKNSKSDLKLEYKYDKIGNWIEKKSYNFAGRIYSITKRTITYY